MNINFHRLLQSEDSFDTRQQRHPKAESSALPSKKLKNPKKRIKIIFSNYLLQLKLKTYVLSSVQLFLDIDW